VGPQLYDEQTRHPFRFVQFAWGLKRWADTADADTEWLETHHLVASGTMIRASVIEEVGLLREDLFLEYVDVEWGLRARAKGYLSFGIKRARMLHNLGDRRTKVLFGLKSIPLHSPLRHYYTMRNAVRMQLLPYVPPEWKVHDALRTAATFCIFGCFNAPRFAQVAMMLRGFRDGLVGRMGRYQG
jgi:rhamnosyltransferase